MRKPLALIPARGGSQRFRRKNVALLKDRPLVGWSIACARDSGLFDEVWVSSEDDEILAVAARCGGRPVPRDPRWATHDATVIEVCRQVLERPEVAAGGYTDLYLMLPTSPLRDPARVREAWRLYVDSGADALLSVVPTGHPPEWALSIVDERLGPKYPDLFDIPRRQLTPSYRHDGGHVLRPIGAILAGEGYFGARTIPLPVGTRESVDVDEETDLLWAAFLLDHPEVGG